MGKGELISETRGRHIPFLPQDVDITLDMHIGKLDVSTPLLVAEGFPGLINTVSGLSLCVLTTLDKYLNALNAC